MEPTIHTTENQSQTGGQTSARPLYRGAQIVWYIYTIIAVILGFRFILRLLGANPAAGFTDFVYTISWPLVAPFFNVFSQTRITSGSVFEWTTLLALLVYWVLAFVIVKLFVISRPVSQRDAQQKLNSSDTV